MIGGRKLGDKDIRRLNTVKARLFALRSNLGVFTGRKKKAFIDECVDNINAILRGDDYKHLMTSAAEEET